MKLFRISQVENCGYDTYDSAVVAAPDAQTARTINPSNGKKIDEMDKWQKLAWCSSADKVVVTYLGEAADGIEQGVICSSFNAG